MVYRTYVAPELSLEATDALAWAASLSVLWSALPAGSLWLRVAPSSLSPNSGGTQLPLVPGGARQAWTAEAGVIVRP